MTTIKKPPDEIRTLKIPLKKIIKNEKLIPIIFDAVSRTNQIIIHTYMFLRLWILDKYNNKMDIPTITEDIIHMGFKALTLESFGPKPKGQNKIYYEEFLKFYENIYKQLGYTQKLNGKNLSQILNYSATSIKTCIENNIKLHFFDYMRRFVNTSFSKQHSEILESYKGKEKTEMTECLKKELLAVKQDLLDNTKLSDKKYHKWIDIHRPNIFPKDIETVTQSDINGDPCKFIKNMIYMVTQLENNDQKLFQFFPLRTSIIPKYATIDTKTLIELFEKDKQEKLKDIEKYKKEIWKTHFKTDCNIFKMNNYSFNYLISTDCYAVSINFIHDDFLEKKNEKSKLMANGRINQKINTKGLSQKEKDKLKHDKKELQKAKQKAARQKKKEEFSKLTKEEKKQFMENKKKNTYIEFPYIDELSQNTLKDLLNNCIYIDPGKRDLLKIIDDDDNLFTFSNREYINKTKRKEYSNYFQKYKDKTGISKIEAQLSDFNSKSCDIDKFKKYISKKNEINGKLFSAYCHEKFRKYNWYSFINKQKTESNLLNTIENKYGKEGKKLNIVIGDWGKGKQMRGFISTPMIGMKRVLARRFNVYTIDEFRTSKYHYKTETIGKNLYVTDKNNESKKIHSVVTFKMENNCMGCINRDVNAVKNMRKLVKHWIKYNEKPDVKS
ncbi:hypothetical protein Indivirus_1_31 [Indivirus ILV1]|uniref:Uncharacterized protein n=1 Tax=Indivirus ILV1 TaxID=1977633 RepID=A0A1V0SCM4_9VIRU|nr:hypothetical protein Indivirus_1_31 [Indivirus ILV1]